LENADATDWPEAAGDGFVTNFSGLEKNSVSPA